MNGTEHERRTHTLAVEATGMGRQLKKGPSDSPETEHPVTKSCAPLAISVARDKLGPRRRGRGGLRGREAL